VSVPEPITQVATVGIPAVGLRPGPPVARRPALLIVTADALVGQSLGHVFRDQFDLLICPSGQAALGMVQRGTCDVVLCDHELVGMPGLELSERLRQTDPDLQSIVLTTGATADFASRTLRNRAFAIVRKPFLVADLRELVAEALACSRQGRAARRLQEKQEQLAGVAETLRLERDLYAGALHDLNGALTVISGLSELLTHDLPKAFANQGAALPQDLRNAVEDIRHQSAMCVAITRHSMRLFRRNLDEERCDARGVLDDLGHLLRHHRFAKGHQLRVQLPPEGVVLKAGAAAVFRILTNLGFNALQATDRPHRVDIETWLVRDPLLPATPPPPGIVSFWIRDAFVNQPPFLALAVRDDGPGIAPELLPHLFHDLVTTKPEGEGTGLGLTVVYRTVLELKAAMHFSTAAGRGTCFTIYLPVDKSTAIQPR
jgi:signal transduction histidine kinase